MPVVEAGPVEAVGGAAVTVNVGNVGVVKGVEIEGVKAEGVSLKGEGCLVGLAKYLGSDVPPCGGLF